jgi:branched-chain amino acid transport system permease protein
MLELILQAIYSGLLTGGLYALVGFGLALVFGTMKVINLAHGESVLLAAYIAYMMESSFGVHPLAAIPVAMVIVCTTLVIVYFLISRIKENRELNSLILTFGIGIIITNMIMMIWSADIQGTKTAWFQDAIIMGPLYAMNSELAAFVASLVLVVALWYWLNRSWYGKGLRAVASNRDAAKLMGISPQRVEIVSFIVAGILATFGGVAIYCTSVIQPSLGHHLTVKAFIITVLAGIGSVPGVLLGSILLGLCESLTTTLYSSALQNLAGMVLFLLVLLVLPNGLLGARGRRG